MSSLLDGNVDHGGKQSSSHVTHAALVFLMSSCMISGLPLTGGLGSARPAEVGISMGSGSISSRSAGSRNPDASRSRLLNELTAWSSRDQLVPDFIYDQGAVVVVPGSPPEWKPVGYASRIAGFADLNSGIATAEREPLPSSAADKLSELRNDLALTWDQLAGTFGVSRRAVHHWASGSRMSSANEALLNQLHSRWVLQDDAPKAVKRQTFLFNVNAETGYAALRARASSLSPINGFPLSPRQLVGTESGSAEDQSFEESADR